jgi:hypothetical protein
MRMALEEARLQTGNTLDAIKTEALDVGESIKKAKKWTPVKPTGGGGGGGGRSGPVKRAPSLRGRLLEGLKVAGDVALVIEIGYTTIKQSRDPELQAFSRGVGERIEELSGSKVLGAFTATYIHVQASGFKAAHEMAKAAVVQPIENAGDAYRDSPGWTILKHTSPIGWIGTFTGWF